MHGGWDRRKLTGRFIVKIGLAIIAVTTVLAVFQGWFAPLDDLVSKAKGMVATKKLPDNTVGEGENKVRVVALEFLGIQLSNNTCARRDLGFTGKLGQHWYAIHGDALWCAPGVVDATGDVEFRGMVRNTISLMTDDVLHPYDLYHDDTEPVARPLQFFTYKEDWGEHMLTGFGGTSICSTGEETGAIYYAVVSLLSVRRLS